MLGVVDVVVGPVVAGLVNSTGGGDGFAFAGTGCRYADGMRIPLALCIVVGGDLFAAGPVSTGKVVTGVGVGAGVACSAVVGIDGSGWPGRWYFSCCSNCRSHHLRCSMDPGFGDGGSSWS